MASSTGHSGTNSPARILVASADPLSLASTAEVLSAQGNEVVTCSSMSQVRDSLVKQSIDVVLAENCRGSNETSSEEMIDVLKIIGLDGNVPTVVAVDPCMHKDISSLKNRGAADVISTPMSKQRDELSSLWRHSPRLSMQSSAASSKDSSFSTDMLLVVDDTLSGDDFLSLDDLDLEPLGGEYDCEGKSAMNEIASAAASMSSPLMACASSVSCGEDGSALSGERNSTRYGSSSCNASGSGAAVVTSKRSFSDREVVGMHDLKVDSSAYSCTVASPAMSTGSCDNPISDCDTDDKLKSSKKMKIEWTRDLHERFVQAVESLGAEKAVPSRILECMGAHGSGLTRQNIASHLQKYRHRSRGKISALDSQSVLNPSGPQKCGQSSLPSRSSAALPLAHVAQGQMPLPGNAVTGNASPARGTQQPWMQAISMWNPWPQGAVVQPCVAPQLSMQGLGTTLSSTGTPVSAEVKKAIQDVLNQNPEKKSPLGLSLDKMKMVQSFQTMSKELLRPIPSKKQTMH